MATKTARLSLNKAELGDLIRDIHLVLYDQNWEIVDTLAKDEDVQNHVSDTNIHVTKDGALQTGLNAEMVGGRRAEDLALAGHDHDAEYYPRTEADSLFALKSATYTKTEADDRFALKTAVYTKTEADSLFAAQADVYTKAESDALYPQRTEVYLRTEAEDTFAAKTEVYTKTEADGLFAAQANVYTKTEADSLFAAQADVYTKTESDNRYPQRTEVYLRLEAEDTFAAKTDVYTKTEADSLFAAQANVYTKAESDARYVGIDEFSTHQHARRIAIPFHNLDFYWQLEVTQAGAPAWSVLNSAYSGLTNTAAGIDLTALCPDPVYTYRATFAFSFADTTFSADGHIRLLYHRLAADNYCYLDLNPYTNTVRVVQVSSGVETEVATLASPPALAAWTSDQAGELGNPPAAGPFYVMTVDVSGTTATVRYESVSSMAYDPAGLAEVATHTVESSAVKCGWAIAAVPNVNIHHFVLDAK